MAFNPDAYLAKKQQAPAGGFDPDKYLASKAGPTQEQRDWAAAFGTTAQGPTNPKAGAAMLQGFGEQASFGYLPQLQGIAEVLTPNPNKELDERLKSQGFKLPAEPTYVQARDAAIARENQLKEAAPESFVAGSIGGALGGGAGLAGLAGKAGKALGLLKEGSKAGLLARTGQAAAGGAAQGAIMNPGDTEGEITGLQEQERLQNAKTGAVLGAGAQLGLSALAKGSQFLGRLPETAKKYAQMKAFKASGAMLKDFRNAADRGRIGKLGQALIDEGMVEPGATFETIAEAAAQKKAAAGEIIGDLYEQAAKELDNPELLQQIPGDKAMRLAETRLDADKYAQELEKMFAGELKGKAGGTRALGAVQSVLDELKSNGSNVNLSTLQEFKEGLDDIIKYNRDLSQEPLSKQYMFKVRDYLKDRIQDRIGALDSALGKERLGALREANDQYGVWAELSRIAKDRVNRENANRFMSLTDSIMTSGGMSGGAAAGMMAAGPIGAVKGAALGAGAGLINKAARTYGNPLLIKGANIAGGTAGAIPTALPRAVGAGAGFLAENPAMSGAAAAGLLNPPQNKVKP